METQTINCIHWSEIRGNPLVFNSSALMMREKGEKRLINCRCRHGATSNTEKAKPHYVLFDNDFVLTKMVHVLKEFNYLEKEELLALVSDAIDKI